MSFLEALSVVLNDTPFTQAPATSVDDFSPAAVARKVDSLSKLLQARQQLNNLMTYMDGKTGAEDLIAKVLGDPSLLQALASAPKPQESAAPAAEE